MNHRTLAAPCAAGLLAGALWAFLPSVAAADDPQITTTSQFIQQCDVAVPSINCGTQFQIADLLAGGSCYTNGMPENANLDPKLSEQSNRHMRRVVRAIVKWLKTHPHSDDFSESTHAASVALYPCKP